jgi:hypothetical protein
MVDGAARCAAVKIESARAGPTQLNDMICLLPTTEHTMGSELVSYESSLIFMKSGSFRRGSSQLSRERTVY